MADLCIIQQVVNYVVLARTVSLATTLMCIYHESQGSWGII